MAIELRNHLEELIELSDDEFAYVLSKFSIRKLKKGRMLLEAGMPVQHSYWVRHGLLLSRFSDDNGREHMLQFAMEGWWITDYEAYFTKTKSTVEIECLEDSEVFALSYDDREKLCREFHKIEFFFRKKANSGYVALQRRLRSLLTDSVQKRYDALLQQYPALFQRVSKTIIASYLGVSRETLSRLKKT